jgi:hypothetical protein
MNNLSGTDDRLLRNMAQVALFAAPISLWALARRAGILLLSSVIFRRQTTKNDGLSHKDCGEKI